MCVFIRLSTAMSLELRDPGRPRKGVSIEEICDAVNSLDVNSRINVETAKWSHPVFLELCKVLRKRENERNKKLIHRRVQEWVRRRKKWDTGQGNDVHGCSDPVAQERDAKGRPNGSEHLKVSEFISDDYQTSLRVDPRKEFVSPFSDQHQGKSTSVSVMGRSCDVQEDKLNSEEWCNIGNRLPGFVPTISRHHDSEISDKPSFLESFNAGGNSKQRIVYAKMLKGCGERLSWKGVDENQESFPTLNYFEFLNDAPSPALLSYSDSWSFFTSVSKAKEHRLCTEITIGVQLEEGGEFRFTNVTPYDLCGTIWELPRTHFYEDLTTSESVRLHMLIKVNSEEDKDNRIVLLIINYLEKVAGHLLATKLGIKTATEDFVVLRRKTSLDHTEVRIQHKTIFFRDLVSLQHFIALVNQYVDEKSRGLAYYYFLRAQQPPVYLRSAAVCVLSSELDGTTIEANGRIDDVAVFESLLITRPSERGESLLCHSGLDLKDTLLDGPMKCEEIVAVFETRGSIFSRGAGFDNVLLWIFSKMHPKKSNIVGIQSFLYERVVNVFFAQLQCPVRKETAEEHNAFVQIHIDSRIAYYLCNNSLCHERLERCGKRLIVHELDFVIPDQFFSELKILVKENYLEEYGRLDQIAVSNEYVRVPAERVTENRAILYKEMQEIIENNEKLRQREEMFCRQRDKLWESYEKSRGENKNDVQFLPTETLKESHRESRAKKIDFGCGEGSGGREEGEKLEGPRRLSNSEHISHETEEKQQPKTVEKKSYYCPRKSKKNFSYVGSVVLTTEQWRKIWDVKTNALYNNFHMSTVARAFNQLGLFCVLKSNKPHVTCKTNGCTDVYTIKVYCYCGFAACRNFIITIYFCPDQLEPPTMFVEMCSCKMNHKCLCVGVHTCFRTRHCSGADRVTFKSTLKFMKPSMFRNMQLRAAKPEFLRNRNTLDIYSDSVNRKMRSEGKQDGDLHRDPIFDVILKRRKQVAASLKEKVSSQKNRDKSQQDKESSQPNEENSKQNEETSQLDEENSKQNEESSQLDEEISQQNEDRSKRDKENSQSDKESSLLCNKNGLQYDESSQAENKSSQKAGEKSQLYKESSQPNEENSTQNEESSQQNEDSSKRNKEDSSKRDKENSQQDKESSLLCNKNSPQYDESSWKAEEKSQLDQKNSQQDEESAAAKIAISSKGHTCTNACRGNKDESDIPCVHIDKDNHIFIQQAKEPFEIVTHCHHRQILYKALKLAKKKGITVYFDSTGGIVDTVPCCPHSIYLYSLVVNVNGTVVSLSDFYSCNHCVENITPWVMTTNRYYSGDTKKLFAQHIVTDCSFTLINVACLGINKVSLDIYLNGVYSVKDSEAGKAEFMKMFCILHLCYSHLAKSFTATIVEHYKTSVDTIALNLSKEERRDITRVLKDGLLLINIERSYESIKEIFGHLFTLLLMPHENEHVKNTLQWFEKKFEKTSGKKTSDEDEAGSAKRAADIEVELQKVAGNVIYEKIGFYKDVLEIYNEVDARARKDDKSESEEEDETASRNVNIFKNEKLALFLLVNYAHILPLWSGLFTSDGDDFHNANVENYFNLVKHYMNEDGDGKDKIGRVLDRVEEYHISKAIAVDYGIPKEGLAGKKKPPKRKNQKNSHDKGGPKKRNKLETLKMTRNRMQRERFTGPLKRSVVSKEKAEPKQKEPLQQKNNSDIQKKRSVAPKKKPEPKQNKPLLQKNTTDIPKKCSVIPKKKAEPKQKKPPKQKNNTDIPKKGSAVPKKKVEPKKKEPLQQMNTSDIPNECLAGDNKVNEASPEKDDADRNEKEARMAEVTKSCEYADGKDNDEITSKVLKNSVELIDPYDLTTREFWSKRRRKSSVLSPVTIRNIRGKEKRKEEQEQEVKSGSEEKIKWSSRLSIQIANQRRSFSKHDSVNNGNFEFFILDHLDKNLFVIKHSYYYELLDHIIYQDGKESYVWFYPITQHILLEKSVPKVTKEGIKRYDVTYTSHWSDFCHLRTSKDLKNKTQLMLTNNNIDTIVSVFARALFPDFCKFVNIFSCITALKVVEGTSFSRKDVQDNQLSKEVKWVILPYNNGGDHWCLLIVDVQALQIGHKRKFWYLDPLGPDSKYKKPLPSIFLGILSKICPHVKFYDIEALESVSICHPEQDDGYNCGVFILFFIECFLKQSGASDYNLPCQLVPDEYRIYVSNLLLQHSLPMENICLTCGNTTVFDNWIQCDYCGRWSHHLKDCVDNPEVDWDQLEENPATADFLCKLCSMNKKHYDSSKVNYYTTIYKQYLPSN